MPDTKFSWRRLREHLRRTLWIYLAGIAVCLLLTNLLWTTTRPRIPNERNVIVYLGDSYTNPDPLNDIAADMLRRAQAYDDTLAEVAFLSLQYAADDYTSSMLLMTRLAVGEGDAFMASPALMEALVNSGSLTPLDEYVAAGWLGEYGLEPYAVTLEDEETGESLTYVAGLRLDSVDALARMGAFNNEGAFLCVTNNGGNPEATMKALEIMMEDLTEAENAATEAAEPAA